MRTFFGLVLITIGALIALVTGLCSLSFFDSIRRATVNGDVQGTLSVIAIFGGIPFLFGLALVAAGWLLLRDRR